MLGVRLKPEEEKALERHARAVGRPKSSLVRDWIRERLERESVDARLRRAAKIIAGSETDEDRRRSKALSDAYVRWLDEEDGGYDWGPEGPPA